MGSIIRNIDDVDEEWIETIKTGGSVPYSSSKCDNGSWSTPPPQTFMVRGPNYMSNNTKIPATNGYMLQPLGFDWLKSSSTKISQILNNPNTRITKPTNPNPNPNPKPFLWAFNLQLPGNDGHYSLIAYFASTGPIPTGSSTYNFLKGDDVYRNSRLKMIVNIVDAPWIVKKAVGEQQVICLVGRTLKCKYSVGDSFFQVDVDVGSSMVATAVFQLAFGYFTTLTADLAFVVEGRTESELPERLLGGVRFSELNPTSAKLHSPASASAPTSSSSPSNLQQMRSFSTRLWKSINGRHHLGPSQQTGS